MKAKDVKATIEAAGFTIIHEVRQCRWFEVEKAGERAVIMHQHENAWHWFSKDHAATASHGSAALCDQGGLGDAIDDDHSLTHYKNIIGAAPAHLVAAYAGLAAASGQVE